MKTADLYIRVSTDEQADKGYSQRNQEEVLKRYCHNNQIIIRKVVMEDHSAKSFIRPEWANLLCYLRKFRGKTNLILFTKWDRFSRNAPDVYQMINTLRLLGVEPQAIEQPLDMSVPENKIMLAIYLTTPEVENDRRSLNVFFGMRRARKEGRCMGYAPIGYKNVTSENGKKQVIPREPQASIIRWSFNELSQGIYSTEQVWKMASEKGLGCNKNNFWLAIRNPIYCGKIRIGKFKEEEAHLVEGIHEPLITDHLFNKVQSVLNNRSRDKITGIKAVSLEMLPLRGFIYCSKCSRLLSGSASKGRHQYYHYYHCSSICGCRIKAEDVNQAFGSNLQDFVLNPCLAGMFKEIILDALKQNGKQVKENRKLLIDKLTDLNLKLTRVRGLLLNGDIEAADFKSMKFDIDEKIQIVEAEITNLSNNVSNAVDIEDKINKALPALLDVDKIFWKSASSVQRKLIGSIYPDKFTFEELKDRTAKVSEIFSFIYLINNQLVRKNIDKNLKKSIVSSEVFLNGFEPLQTESESVVLPLHHRKLCCKIINC